jgi:hypothetical protein
MIEYSQGPLPGLLKLVSLVVIASPPRLRPRQYLCPSDLPTRKTRRHNPVGCCYSSMRIVFSIWARTRGCSPTRVAVEALPGGSLFASHLKGDTSEASSPYELCWQLGVSASPAPSGSTPIRQSRSGKIIVTTGYEGKNKQRCRKGLLEMTRKF